MPKMMPSIFIWLYMYNEFKQKQNTERKNLHLMHRNTTYTLKFTIMHVYFEHKMYT